MLLQAAQIETPWPSVIVALGILSLITIVTVVAIRRFNTVDDVLKVLGVFAGVLGVVTGAMVTYFFTRQPLADARYQAELNAERAQMAEEKLAGVVDRIEDRFGENAAAMYMGPDMDFEQPEVGSAKNGH